MPEVSIILPTRNEVQVVGPLIDEIKLLPFDKEIIVVDYKSTDGTREVVLSKDVILIDEEKRGKGTALIRGFKEASGRYIVTLDADGTYPVEEVVRIVTFLKLGLGAVLGWRRYKERNSMFWVHRLGNYLLSLLASVLYLHSVHDINTGMKGFRSSILPNLKLSSKDFTIEADIFINLAEGPDAFVEIPIRYLPRLDGSQPKLSMWDGFKIGWFLVKRRIS